MIRDGHEEIRAKELLHCRPKIAGNLEIPVGNDGLRKTVKAVYVVVVEASDLLCCDMLCGWNEVCHLRKSATNNIKGIILISSVIL